MAKDARIDDYIAKAAPFAQPILMHLRALIHAAVPGLDETRARRIALAAEWLGESKRLNWKYEPSTRSG